MFHDVAPHARVAWNDSSAGDGAMITSMELNQYRGFDRYRLAQLSRVNLLVGKNNCGKTSILEAVRILASGGDPAVLSRTAWERGEVYLEEEARLDGQREIYSDISHLFHGHDFNVGSSFAVRSENHWGSVAVEVVSTEDAKPDETQLWKPGGVTDFWPGLVLRIETKNSNSNGEQVIRVTENGGIPEPRRHSRLMTMDPGDVAPVQFISPVSLEPESMSGMWDKVLVDGREEEVHEAMRILEPSLNSISFLSGGSTTHPGRAGVLVGFRDKKRRVPLASHGEGMRRLLALSLSLIHSKGGLLLVDEIDTGLHYSVMEEMWLLVVKAAERFDVQVFATTHSFDCVRGLAALVESHPEVKDQISVQKIDRNLDEAVAFAADEIENAIDHGIEVR